MGVVGMNFDSLLFVLEETWQPFKASVRQDGGSR